MIPDEIARRSGKTVKLGRMNWQADSYHIYGRDIEKAKTMLFDRIESMTLEERTMEFNDPFIREMYDDAESRILKKIEDHDQSH